MSYTQQDIADIVNADWFDLRYSKNAHDRMTLEKALESFFEEDTRAPYCYAMNSMPMAVFYTPGREDTFKVMFGDSLTFYMYRDPDYSYEEGSWKDYTTWTVYHTLDSTGVLDQPNEKMVDLEQWKAMQRIVNEITENPELMNRIENQDDLDTVRAMLSEEWLTEVADDIN